MIEKGFERVNKSQKRVKKAGRESKRPEESQERLKESKGRTGKEENAGDRTGYSCVYTDTNVDSDVSFEIIPSIPLHPACRPAFGCLYLKKLDGGTGQDCFCSADMFVRCLRALLRWGVALPYFL